MKGEGRKCEVTRNGQPVNLAALECTRRYRSKTLRQLDLLQGRASQCAVADVLERSREINCSERCAKIERSSADLLQAIWQLDIFQTVELLEALLGKDSDPDNSDTSNVSRDHRLRPCVEVHPLILIRRRRTLHTHRVFVPCPIHRVHRYGLQSSYLRRTFDGQHRRYHPLPPCAPVLPTGLCSPVPI